MKSKIEEKTGIPKFIILGLLGIVASINLAQAISYNSTLWPLVITFIFLASIFIVCNLEVDITSDFLKYKFIPFNSNLIKWTDIDRLEVKKARPLRNFLGWGVRYSRKYGWGYISNCKYAIYLTTKNQKKVVISIKDKDRFVDFLRSNRIEFSV